MRNKFLKFLNIFILIGLILSPWTNIYNTAFAVEVGNSTNLENLDFKEMRMRLKEKDDLALKKSIEEERNKTLEQLCKSYILADVETGKILSQYNIDNLRPIASTSKIITCYVAMDQIKSGKISLDDKVTISRESALIGGSTYKLKEGESYTVEDLIKAALVVSGNDAVNALTKFIAGDEATFVNLMKDKLNSLGINDYYLINASGLPDYSLPEELNQNMLSTRSLFLVSKNFIKDYPEILNYTTIDKIIEADRAYMEYNTNPMLTEFHQVDGLKTGYTTRAGRCLVATLLKKANSENTKDMRLIAITMGSENEGQRFLAMEELISNGLENYEYRLVNNVDKPLEVLKIKSAIPSKIELYDRQSLYEIVNKNDTISHEVIVQDINLPIQSGDSIGEVVYFKNDIEIARHPIKSEEKVLNFNLKNLIIRIADRISNFKI